MSNPNKFTPGPWAAYGRIDGRISIKAGEACLIAVVAKQPAAWEANAALIAAAPEIFECLVEVLEYAKATGETALAHKVQKYISKATGGTK